MFLEYSYSNFFSIACPMILARLPVNLYLTSNVGKFQNYEYLKTYKYRKFVSDHWSDKSARGRQADSDINEIDLNIGGVMGVMAE